MTTLDHSWLTAPVNMALSSDEVHVWRASLDQPAWRVQNLRHSLTTDELSQARRFYFPTERRRFIIARWLLRTILSRYLDLEPGQLRFSYNDYGKPSLAREFDPGMLNFNLSYSDGLALYAIARGREVGIDLERIRPVAEAEGIAERFFSPEENAQFRTLPAGLKQKAFFTCWTRKEAYIKARGKGMSLPMDQVEVSLAPDEPAILLSTGDTLQKVSHWSLRELMPGPSYAAALAVEGHDWRLVCWQFPQPNQHASQC
jgi:4'-phosphopantetheinyl transferase